MRALLLALVLAGCSQATEPEPCDWCDHLKDDVVRDSLIPYPDSLDPATGLPWDTLP